jgi:hypothetical protein
MAGLYNWLQRTWSSLVLVADMSEPSGEAEIEPPAPGCEIFTDALDQLMLEYEEICKRLDFNLDRLWECQRSKAQAFGGIDQTQQNMTRQSIDGAKMILRTARNRVRQVADEIEIVSTLPEAQQQAVTDGN